MNLLFSCAAAVIINSSSFPWNSYDEATYFRAVTRCSFYFKKSPCLKQLEKKGERRYWATCGKPTEQK